MKKRALILLTLLVAIVMGNTAQEFGRRIDINHGGKVVASYLLPEEVDSLTFRVVNFYNVSCITNDNTMGSVVAISNKVEENSSINLMATPNAGYRFVNWTVNGEEVSTENPYTATVTENIEFVANFEIDPYNGHEYVDLGLPSGIKWATCNVGANSPEEYGDYFAWGETEPKDEYYWSNYKYCNGSSKTMTKYCTDYSYGTVDFKSELELEDDAAHVNWGGNWRMPTRAEQDELRNTSNCTWEWTRQNGVNGYNVTSNVNGNSIFLPAAGCNSGSSLFCDAGAGGFYWSSSLDTDDSNCAYFVICHYTYVDLGSLGYRYVGHSVRAVCESSTPAPTPIVCTVTVSATEGGEVEASATEVEEGATVTLTATPAQGYNFVNWTVNGEEVSTENPYTATITANTEYVATFRESKHNGHEYVDLGLPSGLKWATCNVGATIPEGYGDYFAWGETAPKTTYNWSTYKYCNGTYDTMTKYCESSSYGTVDNKTVLELEDDAAYVNWGGNWRMPTRAEQEELMDTNNCTWLWITQNGINGYKVISKINGNSIFLPAAGFRDYDDFSNAGILGAYWSSSLGTGSSNCTYYSYLSPNGVFLISDYRDDGQSVRAVYSESTPEPTPVVCTVSVSATGGGEVVASATEVEEGTTVTLTATPKNGYSFVNWTVNGEEVSTENPYTATITANTEFVANFVEADTYNGHEYVDLGLPSGIKWATCNVGATSPEEYGDYFAWGETAPKTTYKWSTYKYSNGSSTTMTKYCESSYYGTVDNKTTLELEDDAANANWGGNWRMPTEAEQDELRDTSNCTWEWTTLNGVNGYKVTSVVNGNSIFLPAAGYRYDDDLSYAGSNGYFWSSSLNAGNSSGAYVLSFDSSDVGWYGGSRYDGKSVRAVCE